ncbi:MAG: hypothetical protein ACYS7M_07685 [Planctomycetota bacterium]|jgi:hypothetical protein
MPELPVGYDTFINQDLDAVENISTAPATLFGWCLFNDSAGSVFVHFYDMTAAAVAAAGGVGTATPKMTIGMGPGALSGNNVMETRGGITFSTAMSIAATTTPDGNTEPGANELQATVMYLTGTRRQGI